MLRGMDLADVNTEEWWVSSNRERQFDWNVVVDGGKCGDELGAARCRELAAVTATKGDLPARQLCHYFPNVSFVADKRN